ncbi:MAG TPA: SAM-dependent methyltransferase [Candidatus Limnocylindrales bacterium]|nr:SAM-dependent methyltransferase [Candidatus Limnocylindrales bacterium]
MVPLGSFHQHRSGGSVALWSGVDPKDYTTLVITLQAEGEQYRAAFPGVVEIASASRHFLIRTVRYLAGEAGIDQFLDIGAGLPSLDNNHQVAHHITPDARWFTSTTTRRW